MPTIAPSVHNRFESLDVLRGFAILGILLANIAAFSGPDLAGWRAIYGYSAAG